MPTVYEMPTITVSPEFLKSLNQQEKERSPRFKTCPNPGCERLCRVTSEQCGECNKKVQERARSLARVVPSQKTATCERCGGACYFKAKVCMACRGAIDRENTAQRKAEAPSFYSRCAGCGKRCSRTQAYCYDCRANAGKVYRKPEPRREGRRDQYKPCPNAGCANLCGHSSSQCRDCRTAALKAQAKANAKVAPASKPKPDPLLKTIHRNAVGQRVTTPKPAPSVSIKTPVCAPAPKPAKLRDTQGMTRNQIKVVSVLLDLITYEATAAHFKTDRQTIAGHAEAVCRLWGCSRGRLLETAYIKGFGKTAPIPAAKTPKEDA